MQYSAAVSFKAQQASALSLLGANLSSWWAAAPLRDWAAVKMVAAAHHVPVLDFRLPCTQGSMCTWSPKTEPNHPGAQTHIHLAKQALFAFVSGARQTLYPQPLITPMMECLEPLSHYDAYASYLATTASKTDGVSHKKRDTITTYVKLNAKQLKDKNMKLDKTEKDSGDKVIYTYVDASSLGLDLPANMSGPTASDWVLDAEARGKPGWVTHTVGSIITFELKFGRVPSLTLGYFRSYEGVGSVKIVVNGVSNLIDPTWAKNASMNVALFMPVGTSTASGTGKDQAGFRVPAWSTMDLRIEFVGPVGKFKLISVSSC